MIEEIGTKLSISDPIVERYAKDTTVDAEEVQRSLMAQMTPTERCALALKLSVEVRELSKAAIRRRFPHFSEVQVGLKFIELHYGAELANEIRRRSLKRLA